LGLGRVAWEEGETAPPLQRSEEEGIATVAISLIRPQTENTKPPRALWVPFELGRPFGPPGDAAFQRRVILAALGMLERDNGWMTEPWAAQLTIIEMPRLTFEALYALRVAINGALLSLSSSSMMRGGAMMDRPAGSSICSCARPTRSSTTGYHHRFGRK
jgi:hypothetical protein